jgi:NAD(P)-dependent dehydrogenase (short-subunit alcohol dehydrogenase family)
MSDTSDLQLLAGRHAVVTGGSRGIGAAIAKALAARGANITVMSRQTASAHTIACDVSDAASVARAFELARKAFGRVDVLINNAGQTRAAAFQDIAGADLQQLLSVNVGGTMLCTQQVLPAMIEAGAGRVVNIASTAGLRGYATAAAYCASKHAVIGLTRALALEVARHGITVNAVCPGYVEGTAMLDTAIANVMRSTARSEDDARARLARASPRGTFVTLQEVADAVLWLCSPGASAITGQAIVVASGEVM